MRKFKKALLVLGLASAIPMSTSWGQLNHSTWAIDEWGSAVLSGSNTGSATGQLGTDPISGVVTLSYQLGSLPLVQGDIFLLDVQTSEISDLIRFAPDGRMYWFSLLSPGDPYPTLADVSQLPAPWMNVVTNGEGSAGADYFAGAGKPGFDPTGTMPNLEYIFLNPVVPEPSSLGLLLVGAGLCWSRGKRRQASLL